MVALKKRNVQICMFLFLVKATFLLTDYFEYDNISHVVLCNKFVIIVIKFKEMNILYENNVHTLQNRRV